MHKLCHSTKYTFQILNKITHFECAHGASMFAGLMHQTIQLWSVVIIFDVIMFNDYFSDDPYKVMGVKIKK